MYQLNINARSQREIKKIRRIYQQNAVRDALRELKADPFTGKPLTQELTGRYSYKVGVYRIIYKIDELDKKVYVLKVGHRSVVYS